MKTYNHLPLVAAIFMACPSTTFAQWQKVDLPNTSLPAHVPEFGVDQSIWFQTFAYVANPDLLLPFESLRSSDGGQTFKKGRIFDDSRDFEFDLSPLDSQTAFLVAAGAEYLFRKTTDGGDTWVDMPLKPETYPDLAHFWNANDGLFIADPDDLGLYVGITHDGGQTFSRVDNATLPTLSPDEFPIIGDFKIENDRIFMPIANFADGSWRMMRSVDRGQTWQIGESFFSLDIFVLKYAFVDDNHGMVLRGSFETTQKPLFTEDGGLTWQEASDLPGYGLFAFANVPGTNNLMGFFYNNSNGMVFSALTNDLGKTWNALHDIDTGVLDSIYVPIDVNPFVFSDLAILDNHHAWGMIERGKWRKYASTTPIVPENPDLELSMTVDNPHLDLYSSQKYTLTIRNRGISKASKIKVNWLPPYKRTPGEIAPFALQAGYANAGHFNEWDGIWDIPELAPGQTATATFHLFVLQNSQNVTQTAQITACTELDVDSQVNNMVGAADEDDEVGITAQAFSPDDPPIFNRNSWMEDVAVAPNPASDFIEIYFDLPEKTDVRLELTDPFGRILWIKELADVKNGVEPIDLSNLVAGVYFARFTLKGEKVRVKSFVVQKSF